MNTDDTAGRDLLGPLRHEPVPPSKVEVLQLVTAGRRRVRARRWAGVTGAGALTAVALAATFTLVQPQAPALTATPGPNAMQPGDAPTPPAARPQAPAFPASCTASLLAVPPDAVDSYVSGGDSTGRYLVGGAGSADFDFRPVLWDNGTPIAIPAPGDNLVSVVVNSSGVVAGTSDKLGDGTVSVYNWVYRNGQVTQLGEVLTEPGTFIAVVDINSSGDILADSRFDSGEAFGRRKAGIWRSYGAGGFHELATAEGPRRVSATALDDDGTVVGRQLIADGFSGERGLVWTGDKLIAMPAPAGYGPGGAMRLLRKGWAVGDYQQPGKQEHELTTIRRDLITGQDTVITTLTMARGVNSHGWLAGHVQQSQHVQVPAIATDTAQLTLALPAGAVAQTDGVGAVSISDDGRKVGGNVAKPGDHRAGAAWSCQ